MQVETIYTFKNYLYIADPVSSHKIKSRILFALSKLRVDDCFERVLTIVIEELTTLMINCYYVLVNLRNLYQHLYSTPLRLLLTNKLTRLHNSTTP